MDQAEIPREHPGNLDHQETCKVEKFVLINQQNNYVKSIDFCKHIQAKTLSAKPLEKPRI